RARDAERRRGPVDDDGAPTPGELTGAGAARRAADLKTMQAVLVVEHDGAVAATREPYKRDLRTSNGAVLEPERTGAGVADRQPRGRPDQLHGRPGTG